MLNKTKLQELVEELDILDMKIQKERNLLDNLENIKRNLEIEFEENLYSWDDKTLMKG